MDLYTGFWDAQEMAHTARGGIPVVYPAVPAGAILENADNAEIDRMAYQRGAIMLHELVHYVTGQDYTLLGPAFERLFNDPHERPTANLGAALDLAPREWVVQGTNVRNPSPLCRRAHRSSSNTMVGRSDRSGTAAGIPAASPQR